MKRKLADGPALRQQLLIDKEVQSVLIFRAALYGSACITYFIVIQFFTQSMLHHGVALDEMIWNLADEIMYCLPGVLLLGPLMVYDMLQVTNRFAGPNFSMRREMQNLIDGKPSRKISFRNDDHWSAMADQFNQIREELLELRAEKNADDLLDEEDGPTQSVAEVDATNALVEDADDQEATVEEVITADDSEVIEEETKVEEAVAS